MEEQNETTLLDRAQHEIFMNLLPVILFMAIVGFVGILGNILTILFYASKPKRRPSNIQIMCLAIFDLLVCCMIIPNIIEMVVNVKYNEGIACKFTHFFGLWTVACSCFTLWVISLDRYWKICKPFSKQMTVKSTRSAVIAIVIGTFFQSVRNFFNYNSTEVHIDVLNKNETIKGQYCSTTDDPRLKISVTVFSALDFLLVLICLVSLIVTYSCIIYSLVRLKGRKKLMASPVHIRVGQNGNTNIKEESDVISGVSDTQKPPNTSDSVAYGSTQWCDPTYTSDNVTNSQITSAVTGGEVFSTTSLRKTITKRNARKRKRKIPAKSTSERNLTFMMLTVSLLFVLCFVPFFVIKIVMRLALKTGVEFELTVAIQFALKLVYVNSVFNPIVYCFFNPQLRRYIKSFLLKCLRCHCK